MKKHLALSLGLFLVAPLTFAQNNRDIKKLEKGQKSIDRNLEKIQKYFGQDMTAKFQCFPEYQASFEDLKSNLASGAVFL